MAALSPLFAGDNIDLSGDVTHGTPPKPMTVPCALFFIEHERVKKFNDFVGTAAQMQDAMMEAFVAVMKAQPEPLLTLPTTWPTSVEQNGAFVLEMWLSRAVDNYLTYLAQLLAEIFRAKPEAMSSSKKTKTHAEILAFSSMAELRQALAEERVQALSYGNMEERTTYLAERGLQLFNDDAEQRQVELWIKIRNLLVHNRGIVNTTFLKHAPKAEPLLGRRLLFRDYEILGAVALLSRVVAATDSRAVAKFALTEVIDSIDQIQGGASLVTIGKKAPEAS